MTPKEKAIELLEKFKKYAHSNPSHESELFYRRLKENAKKCALIAVDEILNTYPTKNIKKYYVDSGGNKTDEYFYETHSDTNYWVEVKQEIEKL